MVACIKTVAFKGVKAITVEVQVQFSSGLPVFNIVGLPDKAVGESRERVRSVIQSLGLSLPAKRIIINLAPADLSKEGSHFDLPIILAILQKMGVIPEDAINEYYALGELSLDGRIMSVAGVLPAAMQANIDGFGIICPNICGAEARLAGEDISILAPLTIIALINHIKGTQILTPPEININKEVINNTDIANVKGQKIAKRALEIAAAGGHNLLMSGAPGTGKSMLASCLPSILPPLSVKEILEISMISSVAGILQNKGISALRPYRTPHHSTSMAAMIGGGRNAKAGEISLAHHGVLFLDELPEFNRSVLESLRQPIETGEVTIARANAHFTYPANFQLIAAMNPCKCGYLSDIERTCNKAPQCGDDYLAKISGPLMDRMDLSIEVTQPEFTVMKETDNENSTSVAKRVKKARDLQISRYHSNFASNAKAASSEIEKFTNLCMSGQKLLDDAANQFRLSMRGYMRILRVSRTIADLNGEINIARHHLAEALSYRQMQYGNNIARRKF